MWSSYSKRSFTIGRLTYVLTLGCLIVLTARGAAVSTIGSSANSPFLQYGPLEFRPHFSYSGSYNDGLMVRRGFPANSYIDAFAPGFLLKLGDRWSVDYTPTWTYYSNPGFRDTLGHAVRAAGSVVYTQSALAFNQTYSYTANPLAETGRQTDIEAVGTDITAVHMLGPMLALQGGVAQKLTFVSASPDFYEWTLFGSLQSTFSDTITARVIGTSGYAAVLKSADMVYVQPGGEISWSPTARLSFNGGISLDYRVLFAQRWRWLENLLFGGSFQFAPFSTSKIQGKVARTIAPSLFNGQTSDATRWSIGGEQRFLGHFWLNGGLDYDNVRYLTIGRSEGLRRKDNIWTYKVAVRTTFLSRGGISVSYQDTDNSSNVPGYALKSSRIGCDVSWRY